MSHTYTLYELEVSVLGDPDSFRCSHRPGYAFSVLGENITFMQTTQFSMYSLAALLPLLPAKQRPTSDGDWMGTEHIVACPDPACGAQFKVKRLGRVEYSNPKY